MRPLIILLYLSGLSALSSCEHIAKIPDFEACVVELPYSKEGYCKRVVSQNERRIPKEVWVKERRSMVCLPSASYKMIKNEFYRACYNSQCEQALDSVGEIFDVLDNAISLYDKAVGF